MTIIPSRPPTFTCAICNRDENSDGKSFWKWAIPPLCRSCEHGGPWARGYNYGNRYSLETSPDKRILSQIRALADQLQCEAIQHVRT